MLWTLQSSVIPSSFGLKPSKTEDHSDSFSCVVVTLQRGKKCNDLDKHDGEIPQARAAAAQTSSSSSGLLSLWPKHSLDGWSCASSVTPSWDLWVCWVDSYLGKSIARDREGDSKNQIPVQNDKRAAKTLYSRRCFKLHIYSELMQAGDDHKHPGKELFNRTTIWSQLMAGFPFPAAAAIKAPCWLFCKPFWCPG